MNKYIFLLIVICFFSSCQHRHPSHSTYQQQQNDLQKLYQNGNIKIGVKEHAPPFSQMNDQGDLMGFDVDIAKAIAAELEMNLELVPLTSKDRIPFLQEGKVDAVIATMTITQSRDREVDFTIPYFQDGQSLIFLKNQPLQSYQDLKAKKVGAAAGTTSFLNIVKAQPECSAIPFPNYNEGIEALLKQKIDAFTGDFLVIKGLIDKHPKKEELVVRGGRFTVEPYGIAIRENQSDLRDKLNQIIMKLWESGLWKSSYQKWLGQGSIYKDKNNFSIQMIR